MPSGRSWLYSSNVGQYFARTGEDTKLNVDVRESFSWSPIVLLGRRYVLDRMSGGTTWLVAAWRSPTESKSPCPS